MKSRPLGRKGVVVGDRVRLVGDVSGADGRWPASSRSTSAPTVLRRTADDDDPVERVIVANADQLVVVAALADPEPRTGLIDRALVAAYDAGMDPLLCLTKADLADPEPLLATYRPLDVPYVVTQRGGDLTRGAGAARAAAPACCSGTAASASPRWSTRWCPTPTARSAWSTPSPAAAGTPRPRRSCWRCPAARLDRRHPGHPLVRAGPRRAGALIRAFPDLEDADRRLPARLHPRRGRARVRARRGVAARRGRRRGWSRSAGCSPRVSGDPATEASASLLQPAPDCLGAGIAGQRSSPGPRRETASIASSDHSTSGSCRPRPHRSELEPGRATQRPRPQHHEHGEHDASARAARSGALRVESRTGGDCVAARRTAGSRKFSPGVVRRHDRASADRRRARPSGHRVGPAPPRQHGVQQRAASAASGTSTTAAWTTSGCSGKPVDLHGRAP